MIIDSSHQRVRVIDWGVSEYYFPGMPLFTTPFSPRSASNFVLLRDWLEHASQAVVSVTHPLCALLLLFIRP